jgi:hypothetical protein
LFAALTDMPDIITPFVNVPPIDFWTELNKLNQKRKILFSPPPINNQIKSPIGFNHCFICNKYTQTIPYFALSVCHKCWANRTNTKEYKNNVMLSSYDDCSICGKFFVNGVMVLNVPLCDYCRFYITNVIRRAFGVEPFKKAF